MTEASGETLTLRETFRTGQGSTKPVRIFQETGFAIFAILCLRLREW